MDYEAYIQDLKKRLMRYGFNQGPFKGCTPEEIETLKKAQRVRRLPEVYRQFLLAMGHSGTGILFVGSDSNYSELLTMKDDAIELIEENKRIAMEYLPKNSRLRYRRTLL